MKLLFFYFLNVSELVDEVACHSDSTSEEHSLSSYTSDSFDDNGENLLERKWNLLKIVSLVELFGELGSFNVPSQITPW